MSTSTRSHNPPGTAGHELYTVPKKKKGKKKLLLGLIVAAVLVTIIVNAAGGGGGGGESAPAEPPAVGDGAVAGAKIGAKVRDGKFEFVVTGVERVGTTLGSGVVEETAQGEFVIVRVNVTNVGDEAQALSSNGQVLYNGEGQKFEPSDALFALEGASDFFLNSINPGNSVTGAPLLFDVAPGTVLDRVELHDSLFSDGVSVSLVGS